MSDKEICSNTLSDNRDEPITHNIRERQIDAESASASLSPNHLSSYEAPVSYLPVKPVTTLFNGVTATQTMFGRLQHDRVTFLIDTSGSMYGCLSAVKSHLVTAIREMCQRPDSYVNIVKFDAEVTKWTDKMVKT